MDDILAVRPLMNPGRSWERMAAGMLAGLMAAVGALAADTTPPPADDDELEGAIGLILSHRPRFAGSSSYEVKPVPAGFLRWGRLTVTGAGGFTTRRKDDVDRGLGAELVNRERLRLSLHLRYDNGRAEGDNPELAGMGAIKRTLRARLSTRWDLTQDLRLSAGVSADLLGRVGGYLVDTTVTRQWRLSPDTTWHMALGLTAASDRYLQAWHGVTPEQAARTGYEVFTVPEGLKLRDIGLSGTLRTDFSPRWSGFAGISASRWLGPVADSPLTRRTSVAGLSAGLVWRF
jgi:MipA family protein